MFLVCPFYSVPPNPVLSPRATAALLRTAIQDSVLLGSELTIHAMLCGVCVVIKYSKMIGKLLEELRVALRVKFPHLTKTFTIDRFQ
jgi:hypothetical protein